MNSDQNHHDSLQTRSPALAWNLASGSRTTLTMNELAEASSRFCSLNQVPRFFLEILLAAVAVCSPALSSPSGRFTTTVYVGRHFEVRDHDQPTKYVFNGSTRVAEITGSLSSNLRVQRLPLYAGWNLCSVAVSGPFPASGAEAISAAYQWNSGTGDYSQITLGQSLSAGTVLWIKAGTNADVSVLGTYSDPAPQQAQAGVGYFPGAGLEAWSPVLPDAASSRDLDAPTGQWFEHLAGDLASVSGPAPVLSLGQAFYLQGAAAASLEIPDPTLRIRYYHEDHLGSSSVIAAADGALVEEIAYFPSGFPRHQFQSRQLVEPYLFTQKERDAESGLHYFGARCLAGQLSCFISPDPRFAEPGAYDRDLLQKPQSLNLYAFAARNPIKFFDPDGREVVWSKGLQKDKSFQRALAILEKSEEGKRILTALEKADVKADVGSLPATEGGDVEGEAHARAIISGGKRKIWRDTTVTITIDLKKAREEHLTRLRTGERSAS
jgi:RHS repeat-associated protein